MNNLYFKYLPNIYTTYIYTFIYICMLYILNSCEILEYNDCINNLFSYLLLYFQEIFMS